MHIKYQAVLSGDFYFVVSINTAEIIFDLFSTNIYTFKKKIHLLEKQKGLRYCVLFCEFRVKTRKLNLPKRSEE